MQKKQETKKQKDNKILRWLCYKHWSTKTVVIPRIFDKKITIIYESLFKNATHYTNFVSYVFSFGLIVFWKMYNDYKIQSFMEFIRFQRWIHKYLKLLVKLNCSRIARIKPKNITHIKTTKCDYLIIRKSHLIEFINRIRQ